MRQWIAQPRCAQRPSRDWAAGAGAEEPVITFSPDRAAKVNGRTNSCAPHHDNLNAYAALLQQTHDLGGLVGCDSSANSRAQFT